MIPKCLLSERAEGRRLLGVGVAQWISGHIRKVWPVIGIATPTFTLP